MKNNELKRENKMRNNNYHSQTRWNLKRELKNVTEQKIL
jgi:hypothetical protein